MDDLLVFLTGLASMPHCVGMCGGFVAAGTIRWRQAYGRGTAGARMTAAARDLLPAHAAYHLGRLTTYAVLGTLMGTAGSFAGAAGRLVGWQGMATALAGLLMVIWSLARLRGYTLFEAQALSPLSWPPARRLYQALLRERTLGSTYTLGMLLGFMPCGLLATMEIKAAGTGNPLDGLRTMLVFGLGTVPGLVAFGTVSALALGRHARLDRAGAVLVGVTGLISLLRGLAENGLVPHVNPWLW